MRCARSYFVFALTPRGPGEGSKAIDSEMGFTTMCQGLDCSYLYNVFIAKNQLDVSNTTGLENVQHKITNTFLPIIQAYVLGAQKNRFTETVLLSTHNICFG